MAKRQRQELQPQTQRQAKRGREAAEPPVIRIRFYDNDAGNFLGTQARFPEMECILVDDGTPHPLIRDDIPHDVEGGGTPLPAELRQWYFVRYRQSLDPSDTEARAIHYLAFTPVIEGMSSEQYLPSNGITGEQVDDLLRWCRDHRSDPKIVFFDWDRTLTVLEGMVPLKNHPQIDPPLDDHVVQSYLHYVFGGKKRFLKLKRLFEFLHRMRVHVFLLTNNRASLDTPEAFLETVRFLDPLMTEDHVYCSAATAGTAQKSNKAVLLQGRRDQWRTQTRVVQAELPGQDQVDAYLRAQAEQDV